MWLYTNDTSLILAIKKGVEAAFQYIYKRFYNPIVAYIAMLCHQHAQAEDIVQQSFISVWEKRASLDEHRPIKPYLYAVAYRKFVDEYRQTKRKQVVLDDMKYSLLNEMVEQEPDLLPDREAQLMRLIDTLPPRCRQILEMNKLQGMKYKDIALSLDISIKTVEAQMSIAFQKIREAWHRE